MADKDTTAAAEAADAASIAINGAESPLEAEELEIELEGEPEGKAKADAEAKPEGDAEPEAKPRKRRDSRRIAALAQERDQWSGYAQQLKEENERLKAGQIELQTKAAASDRAGMENYERSAKAELELAKKELRDAKEKHDFDAEVAASERLARATTALGDVEAWKSTQAAKPAEQQPRPQPQAQPQQRPAAQEPVRFAENTAKWLQANDDWYNPKPDANGRPTNPNFDAEAHMAVTNFAASLEAKYRRQGQGDKIDTPEYWQKIDEFKRDFVDDDEEEVPPARNGRTPPMNGGRTAVAPVTAGGQAAASGAPKPSSQKVQLTGEELGFIKNMVSNGAYKYPHGHPKGGQNMEFNDAKIAYAKRKIADASNPRRATR